MAISGNVTKYFVLHNIYWHLMVVPVKCSFWFSSYINSQTSVKLTADKMQINTFYEISVYTKLNVCEDLQFIIQAFSSY